MSQENSNNSKKIIAIIIVLCAFVIVLGGNTILKSYQERRASRGYESGSYSIYLNDGQLTKVGTYDVKSIANHGDSVVYSASNDQKVTVKDGMITVDSGTKIESYSGAMIIKDSKVTDREG